MKETLGKAEAAAMIGLTLAGKTCQSPQFPVVFPSAYSPLRCALIRLGFGSAPPLERNLIQQHYLAVFPSFFLSFLFPCNKIKCQRAEILIKAIQRCFMLFMSH